MVIARRQSELCRRLFSLLQVAGASDQNRWPESILRRLAEVSGLLEWCSNVAHSGVPVAHRSCSKTIRTSESWLESVDCWGWSHSVGIQPNPIDPESVVGIQSDYAEQDRQSLIPFIWSDSVRFFPNQIPRNQIPRTDCSPHPQSSVGGSCCKRPLHAIPGRGFKTTKPQIMRLLESFRALQSVLVTL